MSIHVSKVAASCYYFIYNIRRIGKYLTRQCCETIVGALMTSRLYYCNSILYVLPSTLLSRLQRVQNSLARLIHRVSRFSPSNNLLFELHRLPVKYRILYKILITYKAIRSLAPEYIVLLINVKQSSRALRSNGAILLELPSIKCSTTLGDRSFSIALRMNGISYRPTYPKLSIS
eukprot:TRINITY_DN3726_c0_g4_i1.p1 TRINITY_DN3726_c0_g4~~TRINITY_DN3726_c0_g4_i1.p1  ORF type:complete len:175 (-),score=0.37 TRINITY_DN3726_c0_g4_i1:101-625(-)